MDHQPLNKYQKGELLLINKSYGWTSFDVVNKIKWTIKKAAGLRKIKVGHAGTLDPLATGLLVVCTGKNTKRIPQIQEAEKEYTGTITVGATTPSFDLETSVDARFPIEEITPKDIKEAALKLTGEIDQLPPLFSAKKINGKRAYIHARKGQNVELKPKRIQVHQFDITGIELPSVYFRIVCSKGTYIRSIARDLGLELNNGAYLSALCRTRIGSYRIEDAVKIEETVQSIQQSLK